MLDRRRQIWQVAGSQRWPDFAALNDWMAEQCRQAWQDMAHPEWPTLTLAELREDEQLQLLPNPRPFDGYIEQPVRVSSTALIHFQSVDFHRNLTRVFHLKLTRQIGA